MFYCSVIRNWTYDEKTDVFSLDDRFVLDPLCERLVVNSALIEKLDCQKLSHIKDLTLRECWINDLTHPEWLSNLTTFNWSACGRFFLNSFLTAPLKNVETFITETRFDGNDALTNEVFQKTLPNLKKWVQERSYAYYDCTKKFFSDAIIETSATVFSFQEKDYAGSYDKTMEDFSKRLMKTKIKRLEISVEYKGQLDFSNLVLKCDQLNEIEFYEPVRLPFKNTDPLIEYYFFSKDFSKFFNDEKLEKALVSKGFTMKKEEKNRKILCSKTA